MYKKKQQDKERVQTKDSRKVLKQPPPVTSKGNNQRLGTGQGQRVKEDEQIQKITLMIREFLQKMGYARTAAILNNEKLNRRTVKVEQGGQDNTDTLLIWFEKGNRQEFFKAWNRWFQTIQDINFKKLEFQLHIYFYIYAIHPQYRKSSQSVIDPTSIEQFKKYLQNKGSDLSRTTQFLSFYALPYIQKPQQHPAISHVFTKEWLIKLKKGLQQFLKLNSRFLAKNQKVTSLQALYRSSKQQHEQKTQCTHETDISLVREQNESLVSYIHSLQENYKQVLDASKFNMIESQIKWFQFSKDILKLVKKIQKGEKVDNKVKELDDFFSRDIDELFITKDISIFEKNSLATQEHYPMSPLSPMRKNNNKNSESVIPLDSAKILSYLAQSDKAENEIGAFLVLQAIRWRFTKIKNPILRREILTNYSLNDLCMVTKPNWKIQETILFKSPTRVKVCYLKLLNYITLDYVGINYLNKEPKLISNLIKVFKGEVEDNSTKKHSLGVLQKLSLLRQPQQIMLKEGILEEIIRLLYMDNLSDYTVQYLTALMMNLSLRKLRKQMLEVHSKDLAQLTYKYLLTDNVPVKNYINGTLYSFLEISDEFKQEVLKIGMLQRIQTLMKQCEEKLFAHQYQLINDKLTSDQPAVLDNESDDEDEELEYDDLDDEEENDLIDDDKSSECYEWEEEYLNGEELLIKEFPLLGPEGMRDQILTKSMIEDNLKKNNVSSISKARRGNEVFGGGRPVTPSLTGVDNDLEKSLIKYSKM